METQRKTGLGGSLLLQRTDVPEQFTPLESPVEIPTVEIAAEPEPTLPDITIAERPRKLRVKKTALVLRDRCTLYLDREVNDQLDLTARIQGRERSEVVSELLRKHLPKYQVERTK